MSYDYCRHIKTNGDACGSPRLRGSSFCYFHTRLHSQHSRAIAGERNAEVMLPVLDKSGALVGMEPAPCQTLDLGPLEDRTSVQMAISTVLNALAAGRLEQSRATALLYGLQLASSNCPPIRLQHGFSVSPVRDVEVTPEGQSLAIDRPAQQPAPRRRPSRRNTPTLDTDVLTEALSQLTATLAPPAEPAT